MTEGRYSMRITILRRGKTIRQHRFRFSAENQDRAREMAYAVGEVLARGGTGGPMFETVIRDWVTREGAS